MDKSQLQLQILQLSELQNICNDIIEIESTKQNDTELVKLLKKDYILSNDEINSITSTVLGKKKGESVDKKSLDLLKNKCESYCMICEINPKDKDGKFIGYRKIKTRSSNKKNFLNNKLKEMGE
ncbi:hypothetical protein [Aliarcobacter cryaerophilus]|uniref:hypothetical protein n=1 Tax=Aliarcobacter cryaerophilus TaxID=28198 RepID=UPI0021B52D00|nr:hypothetical protein [Aliarcobacter cryaerophilus]MCT7541623.1 hypothetical protein [Aliarcobacter cryaerophilus]